METTQIEVAQVEEAVSEASDAQIRNLLDLRLAFTGGGMADTVPF